MKNILKTALLGIFFTFQFSSLFATHMMGGDISYRWISDKKYEFTFVVYRDCRGIPFNSPTIDIFNANKSLKYALSYTRTSIEEITILCNDTLSYCSPQNTSFISGSGSLGGIEKHTYKSIVDFNTSPYSNFVNGTDCQIYVSLEQCCRNGAITTLQAGNFYVQAMLNVCNSKFKNSSPEFVLPGSFRTSCNQAFNGNLGGTDFIDGDSVSYELGNPMNGFNTYESYNGLFKASLPMTPYCPPNPGKLNCLAIPTALPPRGFYFNTKTGEIAFTPTKCDEVGVLNLKMHEYRRVNGKWLHLGYVMRDIQIGVTQSNTNEAPRFLSSPSVYHFKLGENTCFNLKSTDYSNTPGVGDSTNIRLINPPAGMTMRYVDTNQKNKTAILCWTPPDSLFIQTKSYSKQLLLIAETYDNFCPFPAIARKSINLSILPPDSFGYLDVQTYHDKNSNKIFDAGETSIPSKLYIQHDSSSFDVLTNNMGEFRSILPIGVYKIGTQVHPYYSSNSLDTVITILDSALHYVEFPRTLKKGIHGQVYYDMNGNCQYDSGDYVAPGIKVTTDTGKMIAYTDNFGRYYLPVTGNKTFKIEAEILDFKYKVMCPANNINAVAYTNNGLVEGVDFGIDDNPDYFNIKTSYDLRILRRGNNSQLKLFAENEGNKTAHNLKLYFAVPTGINIKDGSTSISSGGDTLEFVIDSLISEAKFIKNLNISANPSVYSSNDLVCFKIWTDNITLDKDSVKSNNTYQSCIRVAGPHDPNEKVSAMEYVTPLDNYIDYNVYFQNTGSDTAFRVLVTDTILSPYLDLNDLQLNWSDAPCATYVAGNVVYFEFNDIRLPQLSIAGDKSISGFGFRLGLKNHRLKTDVIKNKVGIYFDFEPEVITKLSEVPIKSPVEITSNYQDSICYGNEQFIEFQSNIDLQNGDVYTLEMSDKNGSFSNPVTLSSKSAVNPNDTFQFVLNTQDIVGRLLRVNINRMHGTGIPQSGFTALKTDSMPNYQVQSNLINNEICENSEVTLNISAYNCDYKLVKNNDYSGIYSNTNDFQMIATTGDEYKVLIRKNNCIDTFSFDFVVNPLPDIMLQFKGNLHGYCPGDSIHMLNGGASTYSYFTDNQLLVSDISSEAYSFIADQQSNVHVVGTDDNGCVNTSDTLPIVIFPLPVKSPITANKNTLNINYYPKIEWYRDNNLLSDTGTTIVDAPTGKYKAKLFNTHNCFIYSDEYTHQFIGIHSSVYDAQFVIYPNPSTGIFTFQHEMKGNVQIFIYNAEGKQILNSTLTAASTEINLSEYDNGVYCVLILAENGKSISKTIELLK